MLDGVPKFIGDSSANRYENLSLFGSPKAPAVTTDPTFVQEEQAGFIYSGYPMAPRTGQASRADIGASQGITSV